MLLTGPREGESISHCKARKMAVPRSTINFIISKHQISGHSGTHMFFGFLTPKIPMTSQIYIFDCFQPKIYDDAFVDFFKFLQEIWFSPAVPGGGRPRRQDRGNEDASATKFIANPPRRIFPSISTLRGRPQKPEGWCRCTRGK